MSRTRRWQPRHMGVVSPDMNVTPLVDVVLVLLIIFMVVAPRLEEDIPVTLPGIYHPDPDVEVRSPALVVTVKQPGDYYIDSARYDLAALVDKLGASHARDPQRRLELRADAQLKYKEIRELYLRAHQIGFPGISFLVSARQRVGAVESERK